MLVFDDALGPEFDGDEVSEVADFGGQIVEVGEEHFGFRVLAVLDGRDGRAPAVEVLCKRPDAIAPGREGFAGPMFHVKHLKGR